MPRRAPKLRLLAIGAHPDDAEFKAGGLAALYRKAGHEVQFISVTNGEAGHHLVPGAPLVHRRRREAAAAAATLGLRYEVWDHPDGRLEPTLARREQMIRAIRSFRPDLLLTHRPNDYHPDHRATSQLVQDAAYLLTVPAICPEVPHLPRDPAIAYLSDEFTRPYPFVPTVVIDIRGVFDQKIAMLHAHASQFYEWLPYNGGYSGDVPEGDPARREWLADRIGTLSARLAHRLRDRLIQTYGPTVGPLVDRAEAFEACEYGAPLDPAAIQLGSSRDPAALLPLPRQAPTVTRPSRDVKIAHDEVQDLPDPPSSPIPTRT
jgi:LmbE family N-acetylglucosaminyl deacetylase